MPPPACCWQIATSDLLCEGKYAELMQTKPKTGSTMVSYVWGCYQLGSLIASLFVGPIADNYNPQIIFWFCVPLAASIIVPTALDFLSDEPVPEDKVRIKYVNKISLGKKQLTVHSVFEEHVC
jgi:MFS family permease